MALRSGQGQRKKYLTMDLSNLSTFVRNLRAVVSEFQFAKIGAKERFGMIGMDVRLCNGTRCLRMFLPWALIFGALSTFFMRLCTFILDSAVHSSFACLLGSSWFSIVHKVIAYLKEQIPIATFTIGKDAQIVSLSRNLVQCLYCLLKELSILLAPV